MNLIAADLGASPPPRELSPPPPSRPRPNMTVKYMEFSPHLVRERQDKLRLCTTTQARREIFITYYVKMQAAYESHLSS